MAGPARAIRAADAGSTTRHRESRAHRSERPKAWWEPDLASAESSGSTAVWMGWARIPYGARKT